MPAQSLEEIIRILKLKPLPGEGGMYAETYRSSETIPPEGLPARYSTSRSMGTAIYFLLTEESNSFSALHILKTDEIYHFYLGDPMEMLLLLPGGKSRNVILGQNLLDGEVVQFCVPAGAWQGSSLKAGGRFALMGTTMAPGFDQSDYRLGVRAELLLGWPHEAEGIRRLTRI